MMRFAGVMTLLVLVAACAASERPPEAPIAPAPPPSQELAMSVAEPARMTSCPNGEVTDPITHACITACGPQPASPVVPTEPKCSTVTLKSGQSWHDQLSIQLSNGAFTRIDCPRMRYRGQDTPVCITKNVGGRVRGACCPPGHTDPTDEECVHEGPADEMFRLMQVTWEWCKKGAPTTHPCQVCVWVTGAER